MKFTFFRPWAVGCKTRRESPRLSLSSQTQASGSSVMAIFLTLPRGKSAKPLLELLDSVFLMDTSPSAEGIRGQ